MRIKEIKINKYKSITEPLLIKNFSCLHIMVGPNNAGKTNILDAINLFFEENLNQERFLDQKADIRITLDINNQEKSLSCLHDKIEKADLETRKKFIRINEELSLDVKKIDLFEKNYSKEYLLFSECLHRYFKDIEINRELFLADRTMKRMGAGFRRIFIILFYFFHPQYKIILIDEPELHLHPSLIKKLLTILTQEELNKQIFLTTHHPAFIQADYLKYVWRVTRLKSTTVHGFSGHKFDRLVQEINDDNSSMLFSDKVLLVEGVSDYIFMKEIIKKFYLKDKEVKVVYTGGKGSVDVYADFCDYFKIPYAVMLDRDALNSPSLMRIKKYPKNATIEKLKEKEIFLLEGSLEEVFPVKYGRKETKPLTSHHVAQRITQDDIKKRSMSVIRQILETI